MASRINDLCDDHILATPRVPLAPYINSPLFSDGAPS